MKTLFTFFIALISTLAVGAQCNPIISATNASIISTNTYMDSAAAVGAGGDIIVCNGNTLTYDFVYAYKTFYITSGATLVINKIQNCDVYLESGATLKFDTVGAQFVASMINNIHFDSTNVNLIDTNQFYVSSASWTHCTNHTFNFSMFSSPPCLPLSVENNFTKLSTVNFENPVRNEIILSPDVTSSMQLVKIISLSGKIIRTYDSDFSRIDASFLSHGLYLLQLTNEQGDTIVKKFTKQ